MNDTQHWLTQNTFDHRQFADIETLLLHKERLGATIAVILPTLNVSRTVGSIVRTIRTTFIETTPLVDTLAVVDSRSTDGTVEIARDAGAHIIFDDEVRPDLGAEKGKGEALWKSLLATTDDIVLWIDSDIENFHPRFVWGLLGPLLAYQDTRFTKGFYRRPITGADGVTRASGGGRVTEILARPFINMFFPELRGFIQPLSGEYGGWRDALEAIPMYTGYAVEIAMLIKLAETIGISHMAQVDLEERIHENQPTEALGRMSFAILSALLELLRERGIDIPSVGEEYDRPYTDPSPGFERSSLPVVRRPPVATVRESPGAGL